MRQAWVCYVQAHDYQAGRKTARHTAMLQPSIAARKAGGKGRGGDAALDLHLPSTRACTKSLPDSHELEHWILQLPWPCIASTSAIVPTGILGMASVKAVQLSTAVETSLHSCRQMRTVMVAFMTNDGPFLLGVQCKALSSWITVLS